MKKFRCEISLSKNEKEILQKISKDNNMAISAYAKYRIFQNNPEVTDAEFIYEIPAKDRHNYLSMAILNDIYWMNFYYILEQKGAEGMQEFREKCRDVAKKSIADYGYLKITKDE